MKTKRKERPRPEPLTMAIARDTRNKKALDKQFSSFYEQMKKAIRFNAELEELELELEKVKASVQLAAFGGGFGTPMVTVVKPKSWKG